MGQYTLPSHGNRYHGVNTLDHANIGNIEVAHVRANIDEDNSQLQYGNSEA